MLAVYKHPNGAYAEVLTNWIRSGPDACSARSRCADNLDLSGGRNCGAEGFECHIIRYLTSFLEPDTIFAVLIRSGLLATQSWSKQ